MKTVIVTWMDGKFDTYTCDRWHLDKSGSVLVLEELRGAVSDVTVIPLCNVRHYRSGQ